MDMTNIFISIVSHGHEELIFNNQELLKIAKLPDVRVIIKDNVKNSKLEFFSQSNGLDYLVSEEVLGFGHNNNFAFNFCRSLGMISTDWFLVVNPDVVITEMEFKKLIDILAYTNAKLLTVNLYKDCEYLEPENSLRYYPSFSSVSNLLRNKPVTKMYDKQNMVSNSPVEWASGAFLIFKSELFEKLEGFDIRFFMYYEDVDICFRSNKLFGEMVTYIKEVKAQHEGAYQNRNIFSKHFYWYLASLFKFLKGK